MGLTKEDLKAVPIATVKVSTPELGGEADAHVHLRKLSLKGREDWECWAQAAKADNEDGIDLAAVIDAHGGWRGYLLARTLCDERGMLLFDDPTEAIEVLGACPGEVMDRLYDEAVAFNGLTPEAVEELEGNSPAAPSDDSP